MLSRQNMGGVLLAIALLAGALAGCGKNPAAPSNMQQQPSEQMGVITALDSVPSFTSDGVYGASDPVPLTRVRPVSNPFGVQTAISPIHFWRTFWSSASAFDFAYSDLDTTGRPLLTEVTIARALRGDFHIVPGMVADTTQPDTTNLIDKPIVEGWTRHLMFHRVQSDTLGMEWRLIAASGAKVSRPGVSVQILSLHIQALSGMDTVITDPGVLVPLAEIPRFTPGDSVTVTVRSNRNDDVAVLYLFDRRALMSNNGDNTYTLGFNTGTFTEWRHFAVNVFTHDTLYDDMLPYDSETWVLPYTLTSEPVVHYLP